MGSFQVDGETGPGDFESDMKTNFGEFQVDRKTASAVTRLAAKHDRATPGLTGKQA